MYKIAFTDNKKFNGVYLSVSFKGGEGETDSAYLAERFKSKGLQVEEITTDKPLDKMTVVELKSYAAEKGIELVDLSTKPDILAAIKQTEGGE